MSLERSPDPGLPDPELDLDLLAAALRSDLGDIFAFVESLAVRLQDALPSSVTVKRSRQGLRGPKLVTEIAVDAGDRQLLLVRDGAGRDRAQARGTRHRGLARGSDGRRSCAGSAQRTRTPGATKADNRPMTRWTYGIS